MTIHVSVIIPVYNREATIANCIYSVLAQSYSSYEILVIDDGSTDGSASIVSALNNPRIRIIKHDENKGAAAARNTGIRASHGSLIAFLDSDDIWRKDKLSAHVPYHIASGASATCTSFEMVRENGERSLRHLDINANWDKAFLYGCHTGPGSTMIANRAVFERIGYLNEDLKRLEDWDWALRLVRSEKFAALDKVLTEVRVSGYPRYEPVANAVKQLRIIHAPYLRKYPSKWALFISATHIECAYIGLHNNMYKEGMIHLLKSFYTHPPGFIKSMVRILYGRLCTLIMTT